MRITSLLKEWKHQAEVKISRLEATRRRTEMDHLVLGPYLLDKTKQPALRDDVDWRNEYQLD